MEPCGTPTSRFKGLDNTPETDTTCVRPVRACVVLKKLHKCKFVSRLLSMIIARDGAKLLAYCLDYNRETYFFYLVPTNRSFFCYLS